MRGLTEPFMPTAGTVGWRATIAHNRGLVFPVLIVTSVQILVAPLAAGDHVPLVGVQPGPVGGDPNDHALRRPAAGIQCVPHDSPGHNSQRTRSLWTI